MSHAWAPDTTRDTDDSRGRDSSADDRGAGDRGGAGTTTTDLIQHLTHNGFFARRARRARRAVRAEHAARSATTTTTESGAGAGPLGDAA